MTTEELLIHELAARAGISVRTIRYYIEEGLLPQPSYQGKYSYYDLNFLDRLELIRRLKDSYLPLREIREIMSSLTDDEVRVKLKEQPVTSRNSINEQMPAQQAGKPGENALRYINRLMEDQTRYKTKGTGDKAETNLFRQNKILLQSKVSSPEASSTVPDQETWQRITLAPGVELNLRHPLDPDTQSQVQQLINFAKILLPSNPKEGTNETG
jgi:MerR family redox-sensitive transcriptional activator SoxR